MRSVTPAKVGLKGASRTADNSYMIISDEQVQRVLDYRHSSRQSCAKSRGSHGVGVSRELVERVRASIAVAPDTRHDRVADGREFVASSGVSSREVAVKMIGRIISDSIR